MPWATVSYTVSWTTSNAVSGARIGRVTGVEQIGGDVGQHRGERGLGGAQAGYPAPPGQHGGARVAHVGGQPHRSSSAGDQAVVPLSSTNVMRGA